MWRWCRGAVGIAVPLPGRSHRKMAASFASFTNGTLLVELRWGLLLPCAVFCVSPACAAILSVDLTSQVLVGGLMRTGMGELYVSG